MFSSSLSFESFALYLSLVVQFSRTVLRFPLFVGKLCYYITSPFVCQALFSSFLNFLFARFPEPDPLSKRLVYYTLFFSFCQYLFYSFLRFFSLFFIFLPSWRIYAKNALPEEAQHLFRSADIFSGSKLLSIRYRYLLHPHPQLLLPQVPLLQISIRTRIRTRIHTKSSLKRLHRQFIEVPPCY